MNTKWSLLLLFLSTFICAQPQIFVKEKTAELGVVNEGKTVLKHTFIVENTGNKPLEIKRVRPGCGCTVVEFTKIIAPGGKGTINADFDISGRTGVQIKPITVTNNDPDSSMIRLTLAVRILTPLDIDRRYIIQSADSLGNVTGNLTFTTQKDDFVIEESYYQPRNNNKQEEKIPVTTTILEVGNADTLGYRPYITRFNFTRKLTSSEAGSLYFKTNQEEKPIVEVRCMLDTMRK